MDFKTKAIHQLYNVGPQEKLHIDHQPLAKQITRKTKFQKKIVTPLKISVESG